MSKRKKLVIKDVTVSHYEESSGVQIERHQKIGLTSVDENVNMQIVVFEYGKNFDFFNKRNLGKKFKLTITEVEE